MPPFKPQTYSSAAELPQIAQSKLFKFQFGGNAKIENKINIKCTFLGPRGPLVEPSISPPVRPQQFFLSS